LPADLLADSGKLKVAVSGIDGILRGKYLHRDKFLGAAQPFPEGGRFLRCGFRLDARPLYFCNNIAVGTLAWTATGVESAKADVGGMVLAFPDFKHRSSGAVELVGSR
jgi:hypothetical protein